MTFRPPDPEQAPLPPPPQRQRSRGMNEWMTRRHPSTQTRAGQRGRGAGWRQGGRESKARASQGAGPLRSRRDAGARAGRGCRAPPPRLLTAGRGHQEDKLSAGSGASAVTAGSSTSAADCRQRRLEREDSRTRHRRPGSARCGRDRMSRRSYLPVPGTQPGLRSTALTRRSAG